MCQFDLYRLFFCFLYCCSSCHILRLFLGDLPALRAKIPSLPLGKKRSGGRESATLGLARRLAGSIFSQQKPNTPGHPIQLRPCSCRCKMRMSGLCKVEMSGFMDGRATRGQAEADHQIEAGSQLRFGAFFFFATLRVSAL